MQMIQSHMSEEISLERSVPALLQAALESEVRWQGLPLSLGFLLNRAIVTR